MHRNIRRSSNFRGIDTISSVVLLIPVAGCIDRNEPHHRGGACRSLARRQGRAHLRTRGHADRAKPGALLHAGRTRAHRHHRRSTRHCITPYRLRPRRPVQPRRGSHTRLLAGRWERLLRQQRIRPARCPNDRRKRRLRFDDGDSRPIPRPHRTRPRQSDRAKWPDLHDPAVLP